MTPRHDTARVLFASAGGILGPTLINLDLVLKCLIGIATLVYVLLKIRTLLRK